MKKSRILLLALVIALFSLFFLNVNFKATTVQTSDFITLEGVSVRTKDPNGIRFVGTVKEGLELEEGSKYGVAIAYGNVEVDEVLLGAEVNGKEVLYATVEQLEEETGYFYVSLVSIPEDSYIQNVTARAFVMDAEGNVTYGSKSLVKNLAQATLELKNKGSEAAETDVAKQVMEYVEKNYMKTYKIGDYVYVNNAVYEYEPTQLAKLFVEDFNKVTGENIESMKNFAFTYKLDATASATKEVVASSKLYQFFNANNQEMLAKWGWVLDYIKTVDTNSFSLAQMKLCKTLEANLTAEVSDWYGMQHLLSRLESFFTRAVVANNGLSYQSNLFANPEKYLNLVSFIDSLENKLYTVGSYELVKTNNTIVLPEYDTPNGYAWDGYFAGEEKFEAGEEYVITNTNVVFVPKTHAQEYTIKYFNGEEEFSELAGTYTVNNEVTLPNLDLEDYDFYGWYTSPTFEESTKVTKIAKGSTGNKVFYAKLVEKQFVSVNVTFDTNGGHLPMSYDQNVKTISKYSNSCPDNMVYFSDTNVTKYSSLRYVYKIVLKYDATIDAYEVVAVDGAKSTVNNLGVTWTHVIAHNGVDVSKTATVGQYIILDGKPAVNDTDINYVIVADKTAAINYMYPTKITTVLSNPEALMTPIRYGYEFLGWKSSVNQSVVKEYPGYKINPGDITYVAQWEEVKTIVELSKNESQLIDELNPQIFVSSSFDGGKYDINGELYAYGDKVFSSIADALSAAKSGDVIYVFAGTYADALTVTTSNITIAGSNYGVSYKESRNAESILSGGITVAASNFILDGVTFTGTGKAIYASAAISNLTIKNSIITASGKATNGGRTGIIGSDSNVTGFIFEGNKLECTAAVGRDAIAMYGVVSNVVIKNNYISNKATSYDLNEIVRIQKVAGTFVFDNNDCLWATKNMSVYIGSTSNACTTISISKNTIKGSASYKCTTIGVNYLPATAVLTIDGNTFDYFDTGTTISFASAVSGSKINITNNVFGSNVAFKFTSKGNATITYSGNQYKGGMSSDTTITPTDYVAN